MTSCNLHGVHDTDKCNIHKNIELMRKKLSSYEEYKKSIQILSSNKLDHFIGQFRREFLYKTENPMQFRVTTTLFDQSHSYNDDPAIIVFETSITDLKTLSIKNLFDLEKKKLVIFKSLEWCICGYHYRNNGKPTVVAYDEKLNIPFKEYFNHDLFETKSNKDIREDYLYHFEKIPKYTREIIQQLRYQVIGDIASMAVVTTRLSEKVDKFTSMIEVADE